MEQNPSTVSMTLIIVGAFLSLGREPLAKLYIKIHAWLRKQPLNERLLPGVRAYLMANGMIFTIVGLLGLLGMGGCR